MVYIGPANGPSFIVLGGTFNVLPPLQKDGMAENSPAHAFHQVPLRRVESGGIYNLRALSHVFPVVKRLDTFMGLLRIMSALRDDLNCFGDCSENV